ncbi:hypothetical protein JOC54_002579 [Alkalihalobacillus xiaoxiensis]|uniref:Zinc-ribbon domain-containing protein n=1 Tax=Shouchella xiaoxiensis TaxID=766895 RepID=A0ABS2SUY4_9BACI|nr:zinc-ribbon domain-containing protein [Shouchella xiaoxiensis]MBM7839308.1 hypothetical protein [Shouchella xiaoxiensis]
MFCSNCGTKRQENDRFCTNCGQAFATEEQASQQSASQPIHSNGANQSTNTSKKKIFIGIGSVAVIALIIYFAFFRTTFANTPTGAVEGFVHSLNEADFEQMKTYIHPEEGAHVLEEMDAEFGNGFEELMFSMVDFELSNLEEEIDGEYATVYATMAMTTSFFNDEEAQEIEVELMLHNGKWLITYLF